MTAQLRHAPLSRLYEADGDDEQCRLMYSLNAFAEYEQDTVPDVLFYYWDTIRRGRAIPRLSDFRPKETFSASVNFMIRGVDVASEDPEKFIMRDHHGGPISPLAWVCRWIA